MSDNRVYIIIYLINGLNFFLNFYVTLSISIGNRNLSLLELIFLTVTFLLFLLSLILAGMTIKIMHDEKQKGEVDHAEEKKE